MIQHRIEGVVSFLLIDLVNKTITLLSLFYLDD